MRIIQFYAILDEHDIHLLRLMIWMRAILLSFEILRAFLRRILYGEKGGNFDTL